MLGVSNGRQASYSIQDPQLSNIISKLLPKEKKNQNLSLRMDKYVFFRVILTYLYESSVEHLN